MSRIGKKPIQISNQVKVKIEGSKVFVEGPKGKLEWTLAKSIVVEIKEGSQIIIKRLKEDKQTVSMHGLTRASLTNMIQGVTNGYTKSLEIQGVGYKAQSEGKDLNLQLGFSHPIKYSIPGGITIKTPKPNQIIVEGIDKGLVGEVSAEIRDFLKPEPYKGKGIRYVGEYVRKKAGKAVTAK